VLPGHANFDSDAAKIPAVSSNATIVDVDPGLVDPYNHSQPNYRPASTLSAAMMLSAAMPPNDGFFEVADFIGALGSDPEKDWTLGWTDYSQY
jgi:hypothetical protein